MAQDNDDDDDDDNIIEDDKEDGAEDMTLLLFRESTRFSYARRLAFMSVFSGLDSDA